MKFVSFLIIFILVVHSGIAFEDVRRPDGIIKSAKGGYLHCSVYVQDYYRGDFTSGKKQKVEDITFNGDGKVTERITFNPKGVLTKKETYTYVGNNLSETVVYDKPNDTLGFKTVYVYDEKNNEIKRHCSLGNRSLSIVTNISYNSEGRKTEEVTYTADGLVDYTYRYHYNSKGNLTEKYFEYGNPKKGAKSKTTYTYNAKDSVIESTSYSDNIIKHVSSITYDKRGNLMQEKTSSPDKSFRAENTFKYDANDRLIDETYSSFNSRFGLGAMKFAYTYKYDGVGNKIESIYYDGSNPRRPTHRNEYVYSK